MKKLTIRTFILLFTLSLFILLFIYGCIWIFLPYTNEKKAQSQFQQKAEKFVDDLRMTKQQDSELLFITFIRETNADIVLLNNEGKYISPFTFKETNLHDFKGTKYPFRFADSMDEYIVVTHYNQTHFNAITNAILNSIPYVLLVIILLSGISSFIFSHYMTLPIIRISKIANKMANLDFSWYCPDMRNDEIGTLARNINELSDKLHAALDEIYHRNSLLENEIALERERERKRLLFFSGVSHELKTPIAIVLGQLEGMQAQIGVYKDREKYLSRSAEILQSMNNLIQEVLSISHLDIQLQKTVNPVNLSQIVYSLIFDYTEYANLLLIAINAEIEPNILVYADEALLKKALGNVIGNAIFHSPKKAAIQIICSILNRKAQFCVINAPAHIDEIHLPHLFEAFYHADSSSEHGSGLGLYITKMILETYHIYHSIENTTNGVKFTAIFEETKLSP